MVKYDKETIFKGVEDYCQTYNIPLEHLLDILQDQKVLPMIRGKATEYIATVVIKNVLKHNRNWIVQKLNLNAQPGVYDEDISITHSKTGDRLKVEAKNAVRSSFKSGKGSTHIKEPHFRVKCHKSRSNISKRKTTNDRYLIGEFDLLVCNVSNAIFRSKTLSDRLELIDDREAIDCLKEHYGVSHEKELIRCAYDDWRCCFPRNIVDMSDKSIPRTPTVKLNGNDSWFKMDTLEKVLLHELKHIRQ